MKKYKALSMLLALSLLSTSVPVDAAFDAGDSSPEVSLFDDGSSETAEEGRGGGKQRKIQNCLQTVKKL